MTRDSFIARWSRLKGAAAQEGAEAAAPAPPSTASPAPPSTTSPAASPVGRPDPAPPPLSPDEIAALPPVETLTPLSDITPFLRKGVPTLLRNAALRRMWSLNPAIRDYVDDAMEYAMDWNAPGAIAGNGPLAAGDDPLAMARKLMGGAPRAAPDARNAPEQAAEAAAGRASPTAPAAAADAPQVSQQNAPRIAPPDAAPRAAEAGAVTGADASRAAAPEPVRRRRHGGAAPT